jgi:hypothetical protein
MTVAIRIHNDGPRKIRVTEINPKGALQGPSHQTIRVDAGADAPIQYVHTGQSLRIDELTDGET